MILICSVCGNPFEPDETMIEEAELTEADYGACIEDLICDQCAWNDEISVTRDWNWR
jgi:hypothetical protein